MLQSSFRGFDYAPAAKEELLCIRPAEYTELTITKPGRRSVLSDVA